MKPAGGSWPELRADFNFSMLEPGFWGNDKMYAIPTEDYYLLAILNSPIAWFFLNGICAPKAGGFRELRVIYMDQLPIPRVLSADKEAIVSLAKRLSVERCSNRPTLEAELNDRVATLYSLTSEERRMLTRQG